MIDTETSLKKRIDDLVERLSYNLLFAPDYPSADQTSVGLEASLIRQSILEISSDYQQERFIRWFAVAASCISNGLRNLESGGINDTARQELCKAITHLQNTEQLRKILAT